MYSSDGTSLGYTNTDDQSSINAIHAAIDNGISLFDTAAAYGAGHSERLLGSALKNRPEAVVVTKIGIAIDESSKTLTGEDIEAGSVMPAIERSLKRLDREVIDVVLLHPNTIPMDKANILFDELEAAAIAGKIKACGWSTDYIENANAMKQRPAFSCIEHAMHVLMDAPNMQSVVRDANLYALIRSPLAMGLLTGNYNALSSMPAADIRSTRQDWTNYYIDGKPNSEYIDRLNAIRDLLQTDGRSIVQGALSWIWGKSEQNIPIPGARTVEQAEGLAAALSYGALPPHVMAEIEGLVGGVCVSEGDGPR